MPDLNIEIAQRAHALPEEDRARLAEELLASLEGPADPVIDAPWDAEIRRRIAEVEAGTARLLPADDVFARARKSLA